MQCQVGNEYENVHENRRFASRTSDNINRLGWVQDWGNFQRAESGCMPLAVFKDIRLGASLRLILKGQGQVQDPGFLLFLEGMRLGASFNFQTDKARGKYQAIFEGIRTGNLWRDETGHNFQPIFERMRSGISNFQLDEVGCMPGANFNAIRLDASIGKFSMSCYWFNFRATFTGMTPDTSRTQFSK